MKTRICTNCHSRYNITEFPKAGGGGARKGIDIYGNFYRRHQCKKCHWELKKKLPSGRYNKRRLLKEYKEKIECVECGYSKKSRGDNFTTLALNFHHKNNDKLVNVGDMTGSYSWKRILKEISKCIVLCFNCHIEFHDKKNFKDKYERKTYTTKRT